MRAWEIKKERKKEKRYISPICPEVPIEWIVTKFGVWGRPADQINCAEFSGNRLNCFDSVRGRIGPFPLTRGVVVSTVLRCLRYMSGLDGGSRSPSVSVHAFLNLTVKMKKMIRGDANTARWL